MHIYIIIFLGKKELMETGKDSTFSDGSGQDPAQTKVQLKQNLFALRPNPMAKKGLDT